MALIVLKLTEAAMVFKALVEERYADSNIDEGTSSSYACSFDSTMDDYLDEWTDNTYNGTLTFEGTEDMPESFLYACQFFNRLSADYGMLGYFSRILLLDHRGNFIIHTEELESVPTDYYIRRHREGGILLSLSSELTGYRVPTSYHTRNFRLRISTAVH